MNFLGYLIYLAVFLPPLWMMVPRAGLSPYWALVAAVPLGLPALLWYLALRSWPGDEAGSGGPRTGV